MSSATSIDSDSGNTVETETGGPLVARMVLGARLRRLREARGISREEAGWAIRSSASKISRLELGRTGCKLRDVADLLELYGLPEEERPTLLALAEQANTPGWWQEYHDIVPSWLRTYLGAEQEASEIRCFEVQFVPGLLQTEDYAREVIALDCGADPAEQARRLELRMARQRILTRPHRPVNLWAVLDEAVLRRPIGGTETMRGQLEHLLKAHRMPNVTIQIVPFAAGGHAAGLSSVTLVRLPHPDLQDVVYLEQLDSAVYPDRQAEIDHYWQAFHTLVTEAEPPARTEAILTEALEWYRG
ncbi:MULTISPECIES: helix-turn-helix domain-containing protein [Thermomonospora]|uniref:Helix-turn-helix domain protein n=1 Tax=Thermomonospora curvata (strain ATCC 19995 / DSM 43183 / JCM 3096 / KCTC 9072 / NBRC 15933 / NCIMB 10081 / Henssen B9) TaxID=471852 RepID=D1A9G4_THECD|nr:MULTISPECIES: helix-turn-helix transcriptional regulator [Thermomonospora]ACY96860.1 helix-turn-helix domain protein [Thermomonospora curvata DSM 43183]PKK15151.1 MAG: XRE family transcriptional regulator [Thermomonospora sp. CIF 1]